LQPLQSQNARREVCHRPDGKTVEQLFQWVTGVDYKAYVKLAGVQRNHQADKTEATEEALKTTRFVHITDLPINASNIADTSQTGRLRWKIENEGFNTLKKWRLWHGTPIR